MTPTLTKQGVLNLNPNGRQPNGRRDRKHDFVDVRREKIQDNEILEVTVRVCRFCDHELRRTQEEVVAHIDTPCRAMF
jgi:uncharacterized membrane protein YukC